MRLDTIYCKEPEDQIFHEPEQQQDCDIVINGILSVKDIVWGVGRETVVSKENSTWLEPNIKLWCEDIYFETQEQYLNRTSKN